MNKAFLVGYYGMRNSGDDALMNATAWGAKNLLGVDSVSMNSPIDLKTKHFGCSKPVLLEHQRFPAQNRLRQYGAALESECVIFGGGSVLHNARDIDLKRDLMMLSSGREHYALGIGLGPFQNARAERSCKAFLESCRFVGVRDKESLELANSLAPKASVALTFDLAPSLLLDKSFRIVPIERKGIAVCLCPKERLGKRGSKAEQDRLRAIASALDTASFFTGEPIVFVDFNGHKDLGDRPVHEELAAMLSPSVPVQFVDYDANPYRLMQRMASYKVAVCMRLHASIFGFLSETPVLSINYHSKCVGWCDQIGLPQAHRFAANDLDSVALANALCVGLEEGFETPQRSVQSAIQESIKNWRFCHDYSNIKTTLFGRYSFVQQVGAHCSNSG